MHPNDNNMLPNDNNMLPNENNPAPNDDEEMQRAIQASLEGLDGDPNALGVEEQDSELARVLEMSKN